MAKKKIKKKSDNIRQFVPKDETDPETMAYFDKLKKDPEKK